MMPEPKDKHNYKFVYTPEHHKLAFQTWIQTHRWTKVAKAIGGLPSSGITARKWAKKTFRCKYGCPYHGWSDLEGTELANIPIPEEIVQQVADAEDVGDARVVEQTKSHSIEEAVGKISCSTVERLVHLEALYNKTYWAVTGIVLPSELHRDPATGLMPDNKVLIARFNGGQKPTNYEAGVKLLTTITREIQLLKKEMGVVGGAKKEQSDAPEVKPVMSEMTIEDLQAIRDLMEVASQEQRDAISRLLTQGSA